MMVELAMTAARPEFTGLTEAEVWAALDGGGVNENPVAVEVTRLMCGFFKRFRACAQARVEAGLPAAVFHVRARCPIERVAVLLLAGYAAGMGEALSPTRH